MSDKKILDSGDRREFFSGAVRDIVTGKGRCDLLPLDVISSLMYKENSVYSIMLKYIYSFMQNKDVTNLYECIQIFIENWNGCSYTSILEVSKHYEEGCNKYGERNWEKGIPIHCYIDSGIRHLTKYYRGDDDEPHDRAFIWNMLGAIWTFNHMPELFDITFV